MADPHEVSQNYLNENKGNTVIHVCIAFIVILTFFVPLRFYSRWSQGTKWSWDDAVIVPAYVFCISLCCFTLAVTKEIGLGRHIELVEQRPSRLVLFAKFELIFAVLYGFAMTTPKIVILCLYLRIFLQKFHRIVCYILKAVLLANLVALTLTTCLECRPISALWDVNVKKNCIDITAFWRWSSLSNLITDVIMLLLPMPVIWELQISTKDKVGLIITSCAGGIGLVASILRFTTFFENTSDGDITWKGYKFAIYSIVESSVYLITACLPVFRSLYSSLREKRTGKVRSIFKTNQSYNSSNMSIRLGSVDHVGTVNTQMNGYANISEDFITNTRQTVVIGSGSNGSASFEGASENGDGVGGMGGIQVTKEFQIMNAASQ